MRALLLSVDEVFMAIFVVISGSAMFYIPALLLSFITGSKVRMGSWFGPKVDSGINLPRLIANSQRTSTSRVESNEQTFCIMYIANDGTLTPIVEKVIILIGRAKTLIVAPKGGTWISNDSNIAAFDADSSKLRGVSIGETLITYVLNNKYVHIAVEVRQFRRSSYVRYNSTGGDT